MKNLLFALFLTMTGCVMPLSPGHSTVLTSSGATAQVTQSQNPKNATTQVYKRTEESVPAEGRKITETVETTIGAAQKDTAREIGAKLSSLKGVVWIGVLVFLFGIASFVYPPLKVIVGGSVTTSAVIAGAGLAMIILPTLIVGHELLILGVAVGAAALYFFAHRHGGVHAELKTLKEKVTNELPKL